MDNKTTDLIIDKLEKIDGKLDTLDVRINAIDITLAKQEISLAEHIKRSNLLEAKLEPVEKHVHMIEGTFKFLGLVSLVMGIIYSLYQLTHL